MEGQNEISQKGQNGVKVSNRHIKPINPEGKIFDYFSSKGYSIALGKWYENPNAILGIPDFRIGKDDKIFWVEAKTEVGSLSIGQIKWISKNSSEQVFLAIENKDKDFDLFRIDVKKVDKNAF